MTGKKLAHPTGFVAPQRSPTAKADALISGDKDIHAVKHQLDGIPILSVAEFAE